jgi:hypothetical protein
MLAKKMVIVCAMLFLLTGCMVPVRPAFHVDTSLPIGKIEGNQFTGIRYPFNVTASPNWKISTTYPAFLLEQGYEKPGLEEDDLFIYNPATQSSVQIDFETADRYTRFSQASIEGLTSSVGGEALSDTQQQAGTSDISLGPTEPISLKGVQYAAKRYITFTLKGVKRQQGWVYAFTEPYQIFILYMVIEKEGSKDLQDLKKILDSFEVVSKK